MRDELLGRPAKDQDFVVPGVGYEELRDALAPARSRGGPRGRRATRRAEALPERPGASLARPGRDRVRAAAHRALDRPRQARLRDRRVAGDLAGAGHGAPRLHDQRDREAARDRRAPRSVQGQGGPRARACCGPSRPRASARTRFASSAGSASSPSTTSTRTSRPSRRCARTPSRCGSSRRSGSAAGSQPTGWGSSRSCCSARIPPRRSGSPRDTGRLRRAAAGARVRMTSRSSRPPPMRATHSRCVSVRSSEDSHQPRRRERSLRRLRYSDAARTGASPQRCEGRPDTVPDTEPLDRPPCARALRRGDCARCCDACGSPPATTRPPRGCTPLEQASDAPHRLVRSRDRRRRSA